MASTNNADSNVAEEFSGTQENNAVSNSNLPPIIAQLRKKYGELSNYMEQHVYRIGLNKTLDEVGQHIVSNSAICMQIIDDATNDLKSPSKLLSILVAMVLDELEGEVKSDSREISSCLYTCDSITLLCAVLSREGRSQLLNSIYDYLHSMNMPDRYSPFGYENTNNYMQDHNAGLYNNNTREVTRYSNTYADPSSMPSHSSNHRFHSSFQRAGEEPEGNRYGRETASYPSRQPLHGPPRVGNSDGYNKKTPSQPSAAADNAPYTHSNNSTPAPKNVTGNAGQITRQEMTSSPAPVPHHQHHFNSNNGIAHTTKPLSASGPPIFHHNINQNASAPNSQRVSSSQPLPNVNSSSPTANSASSLAAASPNRGGTEHSHTKSNNTAQAPAVVPPIPHHHHHVPQPIGKVGSPVVTRGGGGMGAKSSPPPVANVSPKATQRPAPSNSVPTGPKTAPNAPPTHFHHIHHAHNISNTISSSPTNSNPVRPSAVADIPHHHHHFSETSPSSISPPASTSTILIPHHVHHLPSMAPAKGIPVHLHHVPPPRGAGDVGRPSGKSPGDSTNKNFSLFIENNSKINQGSPTGKEETHSPSPAEVPHHQTSGGNMSTRGSYSGRGSRGGPPHPINPSSPISDAAPRNSRADEGGEEEAKKGPQGTGRAEYSQGSTNRFDGEDADGAERGPGGLGRKRGNARGAGYGRARGSRGSSAYYRDEESKPCKFHSQGHCKFGDKCRNTHAAVAQ